MASRSRTAIPAMSSRTSISPPMPISAMSPTSSPCGSMPTPWRVVV
jgi:hypothetical protein